MSYSNFDATILNYTCHVYYNFTVIFYFAFKCERFRKAGFKILTIKDNFLKIDDL